MLMVQLPTPQKRRLVRLRTRKEENGLCWGDIELAIPNGDGASRLQLKGTSRNMKSKRGPSAWCSQPLYEDPELPFFIDAAAVASSFGLAAKIFKKTVKPSPAATAARARSSSCSSGPTSWT